MSLSVAADMSIYVIPGCGCHYRLLAPNQFRNLEEKAVVALQGLTPPSSPNPLFLSRPCLAGPFEKTIDGGIGCWHLMPNSGYCNT